MVRVKLRLAEYATSGNRCASCPISDFQAELLIAISTRAEDPGKVQNAACQG
jgi:hypothetical protein